MGTANMGADSEPFPPTEEEEAPLGTPRRAAPLSGCAVRGALSVVFLNASESLGIEGRDISRELLRRLSLIRRISSPLSLSHPRS
jgi:hypothetical protein